MKGFITEYQISYTIHGGSELLYDVQDTTSAELTSLQPHTEYTIRVRAKMVDFGNYSTPITIHTLETGKRVMMWVDVHTVGGLLSNDNSTSGVLYCWHIQ